MKLFTLSLTVLFGLLLHRIQAAPQQEGVIDTVKAESKVKLWVISGSSTLNFNQVSFSNWAPGGEDALSGVARLALSANYHKNKTTFENAGLFSYGLTHSATQGTIKMEDRLEVNSKLNFAASKVWNYSVLFSLKSQFAPGYNYPDKMHVVSNFFAPGYLLLSLGMDYRPSPHFSLFLTPASGKMIWVIDQRLADSGAYGVKKATFDAQGNLLSHGKQLRAEFGMALNSAIKYQIMKNIVLDSRLTLFDNYTDQQVSKRWNADVDFETNINFVINKTFTATFNSRFVYDDKIDVPLYHIINGQKVQTGLGPRLQIKESFGLGLVMRFGTVIEPPK